MDVALRGKEKGTLIIAVIAFAVVGASLLASTMQSVRLQNKSSEQAMLLSSRLIFLTSQGAFRRMMGQKGMGPGGGHERMRRDLVDFLESMGQAREVRFIGVADEQGTPLLTAPPQKARAIHIPPEAMAVLRDRGEWSGMVAVADEPVYLFAKRVMHQFAELWGETMQPFLQEYEHGRPGEAEYLLVGLDLKPHLEAREKFRRNAVLLAVFVLAAAVLMWILALAMLRRRGMARKAYSLELFQSELLDTLPDGLLILDGDGSVTAANPAVHEILGVEPGRFVGRTVSELPESIRDRLALGVGPGTGWTQTEINGRDLEILAMGLSSETASIPGQGGTLLVVRDRTEIRGLEQELGEARKLAAVGTLAAGVAHEIRNPLSALRGFAQYFAKKFAGSDPEENYARTMVREADRLNRVITDLLYLSKPRSLRPASVSIQEVSSELAELLEADFREADVHFKTKIAADAVYADEDALKQVLLNLALNGVEALRAQDPASAERTICIASSASKSEDSFGKGVWISVTDNGPGMDPEEREKAFEPFFTSRKTGTGLGLAIVHKTMRDHGGRAVIDTIPEQGTSVRLFFPAADRAGNKS